MQQGFVTLFSSIKFAFTPECVNTMVSGQFSPHSSPRILPRTFPPAIFSPDIRPWKVSIRTIHLRWTGLKFVNFGSQHRPSHLKKGLPGGPKTTRASLSKRAIGGSCAVDLGFCVVHISCRITV